MSDILLQKLTAELKLCGEKNKACRAENIRLREALQNAFGALGDAPEINPSNYDHDQVCNVNTACNEAHGILHTALRKETDDD
ncbi:MAG: hypothetical protein SVK08_02435 [Halobacteriota archaeon]|nr:hypothetical protein [Halobacteriota archaeon]